MDTLALQVVPNPGGHYPLYKYTSIMGTPGLTAFVGFEGIIDGKEVTHTTQYSFDCLNSFPRVKPSLCHQVHLLSAGRPQILEV